MSPLHAQEPFVCDGNFYLILRNMVGEQSKLFKIERNDDLSEINFGEVGIDSAGAFINSIGYRKTDNFIYGIGGGVITPNLFKIDNNGVGVSLDDLHELDSLSGYISGDISLDGRNLILVERKRINTISQDIALIFIDLTNPEFLINRLLITNPSGESPIIQTADVAIHPFSGLMYGYNCLLYTSPSPRDGLLSRMPSSA